MRPVKYVSWIYCSHRWERHLGCDFKAHAFMQMHLELRGVRAVWAHWGVQECAWATEEKKKKPFLESSLSPNYAKRLSFRADCGPRLIDGCSYAVDFIRSENNFCKRKTCRFEMPLVLFSAPKINDPSQGYSMFPRWGVLIWNLKWMALLCSLL